MYFSKTHDLRSNPEDQKIYEEVSRELSKALGSQDFLEPDGSYGERVSITLRFWTPYDALDKYKKCIRRYDNKGKTLYFEFFLPTEEYTPLSHVEFRMKLSQDIFLFLQITSDLQEEGETGQFGY